MASRKPMKLRETLKCKLSMYAVVVGMTATIAVFGIALRNWNRPRGGDSSYFPAIVENGTFVNTNSYYPTEPTASRAPGGRLSFRCFSESIFGSFRTGTN